MNIISKAKEEDNKMMILEMFQTGEKLEFRFGHTIINVLYMNSIVDKEIEDQTRYGKQLELPEIHLVFFVEYIDEEHRKEFEKDYKDIETKVKVIPIFIETG